MGLCVLGNEFCNVRSCISIRWKLVQVVAETDPLTGFAVVVLQRCPIGSMFGLSMLDLVDSMGIVALVRGPLFATLEGTVATSPHYHPIPAASSMIPKCSGTR